MVAGALDVGEQVAADEDVDAFFVRDGSDQGEHFLTSEWVESVGGFVEEEEVWPVHQGLGEFDPLFHAGRIGFDLAVAGFAEAAVFEHFVRPTEGLVGGKSAEFARVGDVLDGGEARDVTVLFGHVADRLSDLEVVFADLASEDGAASVGGVDESEQGFDQRRFACPVGAEESDAAFGDGDGEVSQRDEVAVADGEVSDVGDGRSFQGAIVGPRPVPFDRTTRIRRL